MKVQISHDVPAGWDDYVSHYADASAYHRSAAVLIGKRAFGLRTFFATAYTECGDIAGVLPIVEQSSLAFGRFLSSPPFVTYGGVLSDKEDVAGKLVANVVELASSRNAKHIELRHKCSTAGPSLAERTDKVSMILQLPDNKGALAKSLGSKLRSQIRRAEREEPEVLLCRQELIADFYGVFAPSMHMLGTPVCPQRFFDVVLDAVGEIASIIVVRVN